MSEQNMDFVRRLWAAVNEGGVEAALGLTDPAVEWMPHPAGGRTLTTDELLRFLREFRGERELLQATPYGFRANGDRVLASGSFRLSGPNGRVSEFQIHWVSSFSEGRLVRTRSFATENEALHELGLDGDRP